MGMPERRLAVDAVWIEPQVRIAAHDTMLRCLRTGSGTRKTTSLRLPEELHERLIGVAEQQDTTLTALVERYAREGLATDAHPGIVFRSDPTGRRAALAGGADVWEIIDTLAATTGTEQDCVMAMADQFGIHPRQVTIALGYAADHPEEIEARIAANHRALTRAEVRHQARRRLLDNASGS